MKRIAVALFWAAIVSAHAQVNGVLAEIKLDQSEFLPNEDVQVKLRITNRSGQDLTLGEANDWISFSVQDDNGMFAAKLGEMPVSGAFTLHSAQTGTVQFNVTPYFDFHHPGHYSIAAAIKVPQWGQALICKQAALAVVEGVRVPGVPEVTVGIPPVDGAGDATPEVRKYILEKATYTKESRLYLRITDARGGRTYRVLVLDRMLSFSQPEAQIDRFSNIHVLNQDGARAFSYSVVNPLGQLLERQTYDYSQYRPALQSAADGRIVVSGGIRRFTKADIPPSN